MTTTFYILDSRAWRIEDVSLTGLTVADECLISEREKLVSFVINKSKYILNRPSLIVPWKQKNFSSFRIWNWHHPCFVAGGVFHFVDQLRQQQLNDIQFQPALKWPQVGGILWCFYGIIFHCFNNVLYFWDWLVDRWYIFIFDIDSLVLWCFRFQGPQCLKRGTIRPGRSKLSLSFSWAFFFFGLKFHFHIFLFSVYKNPRQSWN